MDLSLESIDWNQHTEMLMLEADHLLNYADGRQVAAFDLLLRGSKDGGASFLEGLELAVKGLRTSVLISSITRDPV